MLIYREEIDGLRAVAVVPVILYHAGFKRFFSGGYVGVDIFFVISGYLITSLIEAECEDQRFSLINFYERRCRRILPALFLILFLSSPFAYYLMLPDQLKEYGQTLISIVTLSSNFFFWWKDDGYFSRLTELNPLVHTWSLAVEEQFYFIFPLLCFFFNNKKRSLHTILILFAIFSFFLAQWGGNLQAPSNYMFQTFAQHSWASFYLPLGRVWELLLGAFVAFYLQTPDSVKNFGRKWRQYFASVGLLLIVLSVVLLDDRRIYPFPNFYTLVPTCGAVLIILFGDNNTLVGCFLSTRPLRWIGLISYSAYLWHQPLLAFVRLRFYETQPFSYIVIVICAVFPLSLLSYLFVEQPFRQKSIFSQKHIFTTAGLATLITCIVALALIRSAHNQSMLTDAGNDTYLSDLTHYGGLHYTGFAYNENFKIRIFSNHTSTTNNRIVLVGDSYSQDFYNMVVEGKYLKNYEIRAYFVLSECHIYIGPEDRQPYILPSYRQECSLDNDIKYALPLIREANIIILAASWKTWNALRLPMTIKLLNLTSKQQLFVIGTKHFGELKIMSYVNKSKEYRTSQYQNPESQFIEVNTVLERTLDPSIFVNVMKMICTGFNHTCPLFTREGKLISYDNHHLTKYGALYIGKIIFNQKPLNRLVVND